MTELLEVKTYQRKAIDELKEFCLFGLTHPGQTITFKAPTGSGKTFIASKLFEELVQENPNLHFCIIWATIGTAQLQIQSFEAVQDFLQGSPMCSLANEEFFGSRKYIKNDEIVFVNWEKLVDKDKTGKWINDLMKDQEGSSFLDALNETRRRGTKVLLVVDESHVGSSGGTRISEFKDQVIKADLTLNMSATPKETPNVIVDPEDVIAEGMIKEDVVVNEGITSQISDEEIDSQTLVLSKAYQKRLDLKADYERLGSQVNPLMLIQIPNVDEGEKKKEFVRDYLREFGATTENGKIVLWCDDHDAIDRKFIKQNDCPVDYVIFKTAVATGWDCPRAHILVKFREGHSETFETQTVGRILRTAEHHSYPESSILNHAYIYTNIKEYETKADTYNPNKIKVLWSRIPLDEKGKEIEHEIHLTSYYRSRENDYNSADSRFTEYLLEEFKKKYSLTDEDLYKPGSYEKIVKQGFKLTKTSDDTIMSQTVISSADTDKNQTITSEQVTVKMAEADLESEYYKLISDNLCGLAYVRSKGPVNSAIVEIFNSFMPGMFPRDRKISLIQETVMQNEAVFREILLSAATNFKNLLISEAGRKGKWDPDWKIPSEKGYPKDGYSEVKSTASLYQPLYLLNQPTTKKPDQLETDFILYFSAHKDGIKWFWKNGDERAATNFGIAYNNGISTFQPDWLIKYADGTIGVFDTKPIGFNVDDTKAKAEALHKFLNDSNSNRATAFGKVIGGIVVKKNGVFYFSDQAEYEDFDSKPSKWQKFDDILDDIKEHILEIKASKKED